MLPHLRGYDGARPVRIGNGAYDQKQHDVWGNVMGLLRFQARRMGRVSDNIWRVTKDVVESMRTHWREPDRGIWEVRGEPKHFVSSKVMCWVAADSAAKIGDMREEESFAEEMRALAAEIRADILAESGPGAERSAPVDDDGAYSRADEGAEPPFA